MQITMFRLIFLTIFFAMISAQSGPSPNVHKVVMTQKGYIQFFKYKVDVPPLRQFTYCLWMRSDNLTYSHPILSYSKHERDRYVRSRITDGGRTLKLSLMEQEVSDVVLGIREFVWYHVCQSWDSNTGRWQVYLNGRLIAQGVDKNIRGLVIPGGGDLVVGQEYTDFDKGLDDGIEGEIYGFNMILSSTTEEPNHRYYHGDEFMNELRVEPVGEKSNIYNDYVQLDGIRQEPVVIPINKQHNKEKINTDKLKSVADSQFGADHATPFDHKISNRSRPDAFTYDEGNEFLRPPTKDIPFWSLVNKAGREGRFKTNGEIQSLALNNLPIYETPPQLPAYEGKNFEPVYETPPHLPIYDSKKTSEPTYEQLYSQANYKGYDQNDYFPKELLRRPKPSHRHRQKHRKRTRPQSDLYPYPSENRYVSIANWSGGHTVFRRDLSREKNIEILNPDSILIYPTHSGTLNVEVFPRAGSLEDDNAADAANPESGEDESNYEVAYSRLHYTGGKLPSIKNHREEEIVYEKEHPRIREFKRYPHSITDKINEANHENDDAERFRKTVKLGNALNEVKIFRQHGSDKIRNFVGGLDLIPDINRYRSDIDDREFDDANVNRELARNRESRVPKSAGRKLVDLSYRKCLLDRGSPLAKDPASLISWTLTPVRIFGGAVLKKASPTCGSF